MKLKRPFYYLILFLQMIWIRFSFSVPVDCKIPRFVQFAKNLKSTKDDDHNKTPGEHFVTLKFKDEGCWQPYLIKFIVHVSCQTHATNS